MQNEQGDIVKCYIDGTKIWMIVDVAGEPVAICLTDVEAEVVASELLKLSLNLRTFFGRDITPKKQDTTEISEVTKEELLKNVIRRA